MVEGGAVEGIKLVVDGSTLICDTCKQAKAVRNSLPMRSSLDVGGKAWMLKAEIGGGDDESDKKGDDDGLNRQRCEVLSIP